MNQFKTLMVLLLSSLLFLIVACGKVGNGSNLSNITYSEDSPRDVKISTLEQGWKLEVGEGYSLATSSFMSHLGVDIQYNQVIEPIYIRAINGFDPDANAPSFKVEVSPSRFSQLVENFEQRKFAILYHVQSSKTNTQIGLVPLSITKNVKVDFDTLGLGVYELIEITNTTPSKITKENDKEVFDPSSSFANLKTDPWGSDSSQGGDSLLSNPTSISFDDTDLDLGEVSGQLSFTAPSDIDHIDHYKLYWGNDDPGTLDEIAQIAVDDPLNYNFSNDTTIPAGATKFIIKSVSSDDSYSSGTRLSFIDKGIPLVTAASASFVDLNSIAGKIDGTLVVAKASSEANITAYKLYWGDATLAITAGTTALETINATGSNLNFVIPENTDIPAGANRFLVFTANAYGEVQTPLGFAFSDKSSCTNTRHTGIRCDECTSSFTNYPACDQCANSLITGANCDQCIAGLTNFPTCDTCSNAKHTGASCDQCVATFTNYPACDTCANANHTGASCDQCIAGLSNFPQCNQCANSKHDLGSNCASCTSSFTNYPACDTCANPDHNGANCDQCKAGYTNYPSCDTCANPKHTGANCDQCVAGFSGYPACNYCANPKHTGASCDQCQSTYTNYPACDQCTNTRHVGEHCDSCASRFNYDSYPGCNVCSSSRLTGANCDQCVAPNADPTTLCTTCLNPTQTYPRCH